MLKILGSVLSFDFPERHVRDFLYSSRIFYDAVAPEQGGMGLSVEELTRQKNKTPWILSLVFDKKKLNSKEPWNEIISNIEKTFSENF